MGLCVCAALPCLCDPGEVLKVVSLCFRGAPGGGAELGDRGLLLRAEAQGQTQKCHHPSEPKWEKQCHHHAWSQNGLPGGEGL